MTVGLWMVEVSAVGAGKVPLASSLPTAALCNTQEGAHSWSAAIVP